MFRTYQASVKMKREAIEKLAGQKTPLLQIDSLVKNDCVDDKELMSWLNYVKEVVAIW